MSKQRTLKGSFSLFGKGLHTGLNLTATLNPAPENHGYLIQRIDLDGQPVKITLSKSIIFIILSLGHYPKNILKTLY